MKKTINESGLRRIVRSALMEAYGTAPVDDIAAMGNINHLSKSKSGVMSNHGITDEKGHIFDVWEANPMEDSMKMLSKVEKSLDNALKYAMKLDAGLNKYQDTFKGTNGAIYKQLQSSIKKALYAIPILKKQMQMELGQQPMGQSSYSGNDEKIRNYAKGQESEW